MRTVRNQSFYQRNRCHMVLRCLPTQTNRDKRHRPTVQTTQTNMRQTTQTNRHKGHGLTWDKWHRPTWDKRHRPTWDKRYRLTETNDTDQQRQTTQTNRDKRHRLTETNDTASQPRRNDEFRLLLCVLSAHDGVRVYFPLSVVYFILSRCLPGHQWCAVLDSLSLCADSVSFPPPLPHRVDRWRAVLICLSTGTISFLSRRSVLLFRIVSLQVISHSCPGIEGVVLDCLSAGNISVLSRCSMVLSCVQVVSYSCPGDQWCCIPVQVISGVVLCTGRTLFLSRWSVVLSCVQVVPYSCPGDQWCCPVYRSYLIPVQVISGVVLCTGRTLFLSRWSVVLSWTVCV